MLITYTIARAHVRLLSRFMSYSPLSSSLLLSPWWSLLWFLIVPCWRFGRLEPINSLEFHPLFAHWFYAPGVSQVLTAIRISLGIATFVDDLSGCAQLL